MCMIVIAATDEPLPITPPEDSFLFQAQPLLAASEPVRRLFTKAHVYDLSSVGGCACGFAYYADDPDEQSQESVRLLQGWLRSATGIGAVEVYSCWSGDEGVEPETRLTVGLDHFGGGEFGFVERQFLVVRGESGRRMFKT